MRRANVASYRGFYSKEQWGDKWRLYNHKLLQMRQLQHKEMRYALYQVGHPLWERIE